MPKGIYVRTEEYKRKRSGAQNPNYKHGGCVGQISRLYKVWRNMLDRCVNPKATGFNYYGAKQIYVIPKWQLSFENFRDWALASGYRDDLTIDRIDVNGGYYPQNCQWLTNAENVKKAWRDRNEK